MVLALARRPIVVVAAPAVADDDEGHEAVDEAGRSRRPPTRRCARGAVASSPCRVTDVGNQNCPQPPSSRPSGSVERGAAEHGARRGVMPGPASSIGRGGGPRARCGASTARATTRGHAPARTARRAPTGCRRRCAGRSASWPAHGGRGRTCTTSPAMTSSHRQQRDAEEGVDRHGEGDEQQPGRDGGAAPAEDRGRRRPRRTASRPRRSGRGRQACTDSLRSDEARRAA